MGNVPGFMRLMIGVLPTFFHYHRKKPNKSSSTYKKAPKKPGKKG